MRTEESISQPATAPPKRRLLDSLQKLWDLLKETRPSRQEMSARLRTVERDVILPVKGAFLLVLLFYLYFQPWYDGMEEFMRVPRAVALQTFKQFFLIYVAVNLGVAFMLWKSHRLASRLVPWVIFSSNFLDGLFIAALTYLTGGFDSLMYWLFPGLIVRNALSCPRARPQLILNGSVTLCYLVAGLLDVAYPDYLLDFGTPIPLSLGDLEEGGAQNATQPILIRVLVLLLWSSWCFGVQVLMEKQRRATEEAKESSARQEQLRSAGRLAAEIAHQIKNPLGIINTVAFSAQRAVQQARPVDAQQLAVIRDEVARADAIITRLMGYAQLAEGQVERLDVATELDRAVQEVFPAGAKFTTRIERDLAEDLPPLLMQRAHFSQILVNVLLNAREAMNGGGRVLLIVRVDPDEAILVTIRDDGPGIPAERVQRIFEPYFSTKEKGTGLGLAIARHNIEIYGGSIRVESGLGTGASFVLHLPTRTFMKLTQ